jgi:hypothetical protein
MSVPSRLALGAAALSLALAACGSEAPVPAPAPTGTPPPAGIAGPSTATIKPFREVITDDMEARVRDVVLVARDEPLAEGAQAPAFEGLPAGTDTMVVFYRGHW